MPSIEVSDETYEKIKDQLVEDQTPEDIVVENGREVLVRTYSAGVHMGRLKSINDKTVILNNAIRIWYWDGACSLSQLAMEGTKAESNCKFAVPVTEILLNGAIEVIGMTKKAYTQIRRVKPWKT
jgi:hypothetical protein